MFPISSDDFHAVTELLGENIDALPAPADPLAITAAKLSELERWYISASPEVRKRVSNAIERGPIGVLVKKANGYKCQLCAALGRDPFGFKKPDGEHYVEAHHVMPVSKKQVGSLTASNIMTVCPNHHRQLHYGGVEVVITATAFELVIEGQAIKIARLALPHAA